MIRFLILLPFILVGCGPGVAEGPLPPVQSDGGADGDADTDADTDTDTDADPVFCPGEISSTCDHLNNLDAPTVVLTANDISPDLHFVDISRNTLLAQKTTGETVTPLLVMVDFTGEAPLSTYSTGIPSSSMPTDLAPIAVVASGDPIAGLSFTRLALLSASGSMALYGADLGSPGEEVEMAEVAGSEITPFAQPRGMIHLASKTLNDDPWLDRVCIYGDGIFCFDGSSWEQELPPESGPMFNEMGVFEVDASPLLVAVGDAGRIAIRAGGTWSELSSETVEDLLTVSGHDARYTAGGTNGVFLDGDADGTLTCETGDDHVLAINFPGELLIDHFMGLTAEGLLIVGYLNPNTDGWICSGDWSFEGALKGRYMGSEYYVMTPDGLHAIQAGPAIVQ